jgi:hypothetical protein
MSVFKYVRLYASPDGESHIEDVEEPLADSGRGIDFSKELIATGVNFANFRDAYDMDSHTAPRRRFVVLLSGSIEIEASDGSIRVLRPGSVLLAEDTTGKGHKSRAIGPDDRLAVYVQLD